MLRSPLTSTVDMTFCVEDVRDMRAAFDDHTFDVALDKGTLDALLCADDDVGNSSLMMREIARLLRPGDVPHSVHVVRTVLSAALTSL